jgi:hypothetical protein
LKLQYLIDSTFSRQTTNTVVFWYGKFTYVNGISVKTWSLSYFRRCCREMGFSTSLSRDLVNTDKIILYIDYIGQSYI